VIFKVRVKGETLKGLSPLTVTIIPYPERNVKSFFEKIEKILRKN
jgi:hypothetical protein